MSDAPIDYSKVLVMVDQVMRICIQTTAMSEGLASLLIDKGLVTREELVARIAEHEKEAQKIAQSLGSGSEAVS